MPEKQSFNFTSMDWEAYTKFRPIYPQELYSKIYAHHDSHLGAYSSAIDIGAGVGIVSIELIKKFSHVTVTDPSEAYVSSAKSLFAKYPQDKIDFLTTKAEEISLENLPKKGEKVDLVTAAECLHWADVETAMPRIAEVLKPHGTFATWMYGVKPIFSEHQTGKNSAEVIKIFFDIYDKMFHRYNTTLEPPTESSGGAAMTARLDHMPFDPELWKDVRRIYNNVDAPMVQEGMPTRASKVSEGEKCEKFENEKLLVQDADYEYLEGYLVNWIPPIKVKEWGQEELASLKKAMDGQKIEITWPLVLILATKK
ncbi:uncharacterized protein RCC_07332 [Ramularia collo-cygni]|uniref:Methyltransferase type 12 domain-containing protein n=1 Tax=Ramularia collo-cygni TaxID=112498 RepID=A0A2D3VHP6_9PEZI|nr:uncharacterized protein RCC_07332 [Ramularia collo-cygni]CZT21469.1 uncharacterized protein RCC_07332 [Ramularia collo-cygni]